MARLTSIEAYRYILECGWIGESQRRIYQYLYENGAHTSGEVFFALHKGNKQKALTQTRARFTELRDMGAIAEKGTRKCEVSGRRAILWDVTGRIPVKKTSIQKLEELYAKKWREYCAIGKQIREYYAEHDLKKQTRLDV